MGGISTRRSRTKDASAAGAVESAEPVEASGGPGTRTWWCRARL